MSSAETGHAYETVMGWMDVEAVGGDAAVPRRPRVRQPEGLWVPNPFHGTSGPSVVARVVRLAVRSGATNTVLLLIATDATGTRIPDVRHRVRIQGQTEPVLGPVLATAVLGDTGKELTPLHTVPVPMPGPGMRLRLMQAGGTAQRVEVVVTVEFEATDATVHDPAEF